MSSIIKRNSKNLILSISTLIISSISLKFAHSLRNLQIKNITSAYRTNRPSKSKSTFIQSSRSFLQYVQSLKYLTLFRSISLLFYGLMFFAAPSLTLAEGSVASGTAAALQKSIGISQIVEHPALDEVRKGMLEALKEEGFVDGKNLKVHYENAQGNISTSSQIATKLLSAKLDLAVGISTPSAQTLFFAAQKQEYQVPIVFSAVSDPSAAKLISSNYPITGVTDTPNLEGLLELIHKMLPNLKTLGLMYNPAEANSVSTITKLKKILQEEGIVAHEVTVNKTADVAQAMQSLIGKVDALYFPQDNTVVAAIETVVNIAQHSSPTLPVILPIFSNDPALIKRGVLAAVGFDYVDVGRETGKVVAKILLGADAANIPIHNPQNLKAVINKELAKKLGLTVPTALEHSKIQFIN